jgi:hypothetical protein
MRIVLAVLLSRTRLHLAPGSRVRAIFRGLTIAPEEISVEVEGVQVR